MDAYTELAAEVMRTCPSGAVEAKLVAELDEGYSDFEVVCRTQQGDFESREVSDDRSWNIHQILTGIQQEFKQNTGHAWRRCTFVVSESGKFKMDVEY